MSTSNLISLARLHLSSAKAPAVVFIHGLDSSKITFEPFVQKLHNKLGLNVVAMDLRGHGESELGDPDKFTLDALVEDIKHTTRESGISTPFVLLGHSMGGRVAMHYMTTYPNDVHTLIIEDMDATYRRPRIWSPEYISKAKSFSRVFSSWEECRDTMVGFDYDVPRVEKWKTEGRARLRPDGSWWCDINPYACMLAFENVLSTDGVPTWTAIAKIHQERKARVDSLPPLTVHLLLANERQTVCSEFGPGGVEHMLQILPDTVLTRYTGGHSIHKDSADDMVKLFEDIFSKMEN